MKEAGRKAFKSLRRALQTWVPEPHLAKRLARSVRRIRFR